MAKRSKKKKSPLLPSQEKVGETKAQESPRKSSVVSWLNILPVFVITAGTLWIYWPALHGDWLWDDDTYLTANSLLNDPARLWKIWFVPGSQLEYYPIEQTLQWREWKLWGMDTLGYHLTNVFLHIFSALLVWRLLSKFGLRLAWLGGLIFALHPVQVESVAWIAEFKNALSLPPFLLAICAWIDYEEHHRHYWLALGLFFVAMLCKPLMVMFPVAILLYAWWKRDRIEWNDVKASAPFFAVSLGLGLLMIWFEYHIVMEKAAHPLGGVFSRLAGAGLSFSFYFSKCFLPVYLLPVYPKWTVDPSALWQFLPWLALGGVISWLWAKRQGWGRHALLGLGFFLIFLVPFVGFNAIGYMEFTWVMDHFLYLPIIGLVGLVVAGFEQMGRQLHDSWRPYGIGLVAVVLALLAWESHNHAALYRNSETLWTYELRYNQEAYPAHNNLGYALLQTGRASEAIGQFEQALQIKPDYAEAHDNLGTSLFKIGRLPEAMDQFEQALRIKPDYAEAYNNMGNALQQKGQIPEAIAQYETALRFKPDYAEAHNNLGNALQQKSLLLEAIGQFEQALKIKPDYAEATNNLGSALQQTGQLPGAIGQYEIALRLKPDYAEAHNNLGYALLITGRASEAMDQFNQALRIKPDYADAHYNLANALLQSGRVSEAIEQYGQTLRINPNYAEAHNNLGGALQQTGRIAEAMEQYEEALQIKPELASARANLARLHALQKIAPVKK